MGQSKTSLDPLAQERKGEIDQSQNKVRNRTGETLPMTLSNRVENESNQNGGKLKAALALSTLWDNRQPSQKDHGSMFAGSSAASKKNEKSHGGHINLTDTVGQQVAQGGRLNKIKSINS